MVTMLSFNSKDERLPMLVSVVVLGWCTWDLLPMATEEGGKSLRVFCQQLPPEMKLKSLLVLAFWKKIQRAHPKVI